MSGPVHIRPWIYRVWWNSWTSSKGKTFCQSRVCILMKLEYWARKHYTRNPYPAPIKGQTTMLWPLACQVNATEEKTWGVYPAGWVETGNQRIVLKRTGRSIFLPAMGFPVNHHWALIHWLQGGTVWRAGHQAVRQGDYSPGPTGIDCWITGPSVPTVWRY